MNSNKKHELETSMCRMRLKKEFFYRKETQVYYDERERHKTEGVDRTQTAQNKSAVTISAEIRK